MLFGIFVFVFCICIFGCILWYLFDVYFVLLVINDEWRYLLLGFFFGFINYNYIVFLWILLYFIMVFFVDVYCKCDLFGFFFFLDVFYNELFFEINLFWVRLFFFGLESGKFRFKIIWLVF